MNTRHACSWFVIATFACSGAAETRRVPQDHKTIQSAIDAARPGDVVLVSPGTYAERIVLKYRITLRSAGDDSPGRLGLKRAEVTIIDGGGAQAKGPAVNLADAATLDGFTVTRVGVFDQKEFDKHHAERGENLPDERGAVGAGGNYPALSVDGVTAVVRNNLVHDNGHAGIGCTAGPSKRNASLIQGNVCFRNMGGGIGIADGAVPTVEANKCFRNLRGGIGNRASAGLIIGNECFENVRAGIGIREGARPVVRGNRCHDNRRAGIGSRMRQTSPVIEENECYRNGMAGIGCRDGATPLIRKNTCFENDLAGIGVRDGAHAVIADNKCYRNKEVGIGVQSAKAAILRNESYENERAGIGQRDDSDTLVEGNTVHHNKDAGIGFEQCKAGTARVLNNKVFENGTVAIGIHAGWRVTVAGNELSRREGLPPVVMVFADAEADFNDNSITGSGVAGIRVQGSVRLGKNRFMTTGLRQVGPPQYAVWGLPGADISFTGNSVRGWRHALYAEQCTVSAANNVVSDYWQAGIRIVKPKGIAVIANNTFASGQAHPGVVIVEGDAVQEGNRVDKPASAK